MKKSKVLLTIATIMLIVAVVFVIYALGHPEASFDIPLYIVKAFYRLYAITTIVLFILGFIFRKKQKVHK